MDNQTLSMEAFVKSLTEEQAGMCEKDENQLGDIFRAGWSEETSVRFHRAMLHARRVEPNVTVEGVFEVALRVGLSFIGNEDIFARLNQGREDDVIVYGVQRKDGKDTGRTSGTVLMDGERLVKSRAKRARRGVRGI